MKRDRSKIMNNKMVRFNNIIARIELRMGGWGVNFDEEFEKLLELKKEDGTEMEYKGNCIGTIIFNACDYNSSGIQRPSWTVFSIVFYEILDHLKDIFSKELFDFIIDRSGDKFKNNLIIAAFCRSKTFVEKLNITFDIIDRYFDREYFMINKSQSYGQFSNITEYTIIERKYTGRALIFEALRQRNFTDAEYDFSVYDKLWKEFWKE